MVRKIVLVLLLSTAVALMIGIPGVSGLSSYLNAFNAKYGTGGTELDTCSVCHAGVPNLNPYGQSVAGQSGDIDQRLTNIESMDSDGDGFMNIDEINDQTFPGNASDFPPGPVPSPQPTAFNISGFKINDTNGNGMWDSGEVGIENWNIKLSNATTGTEMANTSTDASGFYQFTNIANGSYNVTEGMKPGFTPTNVTSMMVTVAGPDITDLNFTNNVSVLPPPPLPTAVFNISGFKINDTNGNGEGDSGEMGIENWNIKLYNATTGTEIANTTTNGNGSYNFMNLTNGTYNVTEEMKAGWANTSAMSQVITINGSDAVNVDFKNQLVPLPPPSPVAFNISGSKINDTNGNGVWDSGEMGVENWNIKLSNATTGEEIANTSTDPSGTYKFENLVPGGYNVTEETKEGFTPTNATSSVMTVENTDITNLNFTNQPVAPPAAVITSFELTPGKTTGLKKTPISITIKALNNGALQTLFNGTANITITAKNVSAVTFPPVADFTGGVATIEVNSDIAQHVTVTASSNGVNGSTKVMFADKIFNLSKGWNLISIPNFADPSSINQTLQFVQNNGVVGYDPATNLFSTPTDLLPLFGYWINVTADNQTIGFIASTNITSVPPSRTLYEGWNLIGVSANSTDPDNLKAGELFAELKYGPDPTQWLYTRLVSYEQPLSPVTLVTGTGLLDPTELKQGSGYWLFIKNVPGTDQNNVPWAGKQW